MERTVVSCVMVECCVCGGTAPPKGEGTLAQSTGGAPLARARRIYVDGAGHDAQGVVRGGGGDGRAGGVQRTSRRSIPKNIIIILIR